MMLHHAIRTALNHATLCCCRLCIVRRSACRSRTAESGSSRSSSRTANRCTAYFYSEGNVVRAKHAGIDRQETARRHLELRQRAQLASSRLAIRAQRRLGRRNPAAQLAKSLHRLYAATPSISGSTPHRPSPPPICRSICLRDTVERLQRSLSSSAISRTMCLQPNGRASPFRWRGFKTASIHPFQAARDERDRPAAGRSRRRQTYAAAR